MKLKGLSLCALFLALAVLFAADGALQLAPISSAAASSYGVTRSPASAVLAAGGNLTTPADTTEDTLATVTIPANAMGANGQVRITTFWRCNNSVNVKTVRVHFSGFVGAVIQTFTLTSKTGAQITTVLANKNATNSQSALGVAYDLTLNVIVDGGGNVVLAENTTAATTLVFTGQKATAGETLVLDHYTVELYPSP